MFGVVMMYVVKVLTVLLILFGAFLFGKLYKLFEIFPKASEERCWIAWGLLAEVALIIQGIIVVIK